MGNVEHINLYNQNIETDDISIVPKCKFKLPCLVIRITGRVTLQDTQFLRDTVDFTQGNCYAYIELKGETANLGKVFVDLGNYLKIDGAVTCDQYMIDEKGVEHKLNKDDLMCDILLAEDEVKFNPEQHKEYIYEKYKKYGKYVELVKEMENSDE